MRVSPDGKAATVGTVDGGNLFLTPYINNSSGSGSDSINSQEEGEDENNVDFLGDVDDVYPTTPGRPNHHLPSPSSYEEDAYDASPQQADWDDPWSSNPWNDDSWKPTDIATDPPSVPISTYVDSSFDTAQFSFTRNTPDVPDPFDIAFGSSDHHAHHHPYSSKSPAHVTAPAPAIITPRRKDAAYKSPITYNSPSSSRSSKARPHRLSNSPEVKIHVVLQERLSILFDDSKKKDPTCRVVGRILVKPPVGTGKRKCPIDSFCLTVRDKRGHIEHWDDDNSRCQNITAGVPHLALDPGDQIFLVTLKGDQEELEAPIVGYTCIPRLRPMPMLLKTKVHRKIDLCRVGIRMRANPQNSYTLTDIVLLMVLPSDVDGEKVTMSRKGGIWDEMKRTLIWNIQKLEPGEILDIQAQFRFIRGAMPIPGIGDESSRFPVLARCNGTVAFSRIDLNAEYTQEGSTPVELTTERSGMVLFRKV